MNKITSIWKKANFFTALNKKAVTLSILFLSLSCGALCVPYSVYAQSSTDVKSRQPRVLNITLTSANTEYTFNVPEGTTRIQIGARGGDVKFAWNKVGTSGSTYMTIPEGAFTCSKDVVLSTSGRTDSLYFQSSSAGAVVEITIWR